MLQDDELARLLMFPRGARPWAEPASFGAEFDGSPPAGACCRLTGVALIDVQGLTRSFRTYKKAPGFSGALKGLFRREYETVFAVKDVSFKVEEGEFVGVLGPNGAGKTCSL